MQKIQNKEITSYSASKLYKKTESTLRLRSNRGDCQQKIKPGHPTLFSEKQETSIENWAHEMSKVGTPVDQTMLLKSVSLLSHNLGLDNKINGALG